MITLPDAFRRISGMDQSSTGHWHRANMFGPSIKGTPRKEKPFILDVRDIKNWRAVGHISGAHHTYIGELPSIWMKFQQINPLWSIAMPGIKGVLLRLSGITQISGGNQCSGGMTAGNGQASPSNHNFIAFIVSKKINKVYHVMLGTPLV